MKQDTNIGTNILRVSASDEDADNNGAIRYSITAPFDPDDLDYFDIQPESGWIYLRKPLDVSETSLSCRPSEKKTNKFVLSKSKQRKLFHSLSKFHKLTFSIFSTPLLLCYGLSCNNLQFKFYPHDSHMIPILG